MTTPPNHSWAKDRKPDLNPPKIPMIVAPNIHRFDTGPFNWYLIEEGRRLTLVDAGFPGHYSVLLKGLKTIGFELSDIEAILITHSHADHTGFAERLAQATGVPIYVHEADYTSLTRILQLPWWGLLSNGWRPYIALMLLHAIGNGVFTMPRVRKAKTFKEGDVLEVPGKPVVMHTPGHTPGEVSFFLPDRKVLLCGDTLVTRDVMSGEMGAPQIMHPILTNDYSLAQRSLEPLRKLGEVTLLTGHGDPWQGNMLDAVTGALESCVPR